MEPTSPTPTAGAMPREAIIAFGAAAALALGSFLPWIKVTAPFIGSVSKSGTEGSDGWLTFAAGIGVAVLAYRWTKAPAASKDWVAPLVIAILAGAMVAYEYSDIHSKISSIDAEFISATYGVGLHLCAAGVIAAVVATVQRRKLTSTPPFTQTA